MKSDNLVQLSGFLTKDVITNEKKSFAAFTIGRKVEEDTLYMNCIAFLIRNSRFRSTSLQKETKSLSLATSGLTNTPKTARPHTPFNWS